MASDDRTRPETETLPFGAMQRPDERPKRRSGGKKPAGGSPVGVRPGRSGGLQPLEKDAPAPRESAPEGGGEGGGGNQRDNKDWRKPQKRRGGARRGGRRRRKNRDGQQGQPGQQGQQGQPGQPGQQGGDGAATATRDGKDAGQQASGGGKQRDRQQGGQPQRSERRVGTGMFVLEKGGFGTLRSREAGYASSKQDIFVAQRLAMKHKLRDGAIVSGPVAKGKKHKFQLLEVHEVDGKHPREQGKVVGFKDLTTIDPDFHYAVGDITGEGAMRALDILAPIGRGQRALIVAAPRTGKTTLLRQFAKGIELGYPEVHLMVLLIDERPEEATEWQRSTGGEVFVSTSDEMPKRHVQLAEAVWKRAQHLVELGEDVVLLLDSITRLARAFNNHSGGSGKTMSGGLDSRAMERPRQIFGSARNTETAGSLTIIGTTLVDTGSRMDQLIFEEFKGTGNCEVVLNRKLSDRRIFPAIDIEKSGTRKDEKLLSKVRLKRVNTLRRVLLRMNFIEAMELLAEKLENVEKTDDFLKRFDVDPEG